MKITRRQLRRIILESLSEGPMEADDTEKINAMLGFLEKYTVDDSIDVSSRMKRTLKMADLIKQLVAARDKGAMPKFSGKEGNYAKVVTDSLEGPDKDKWDEYVKIGIKVSLV
jgi:hypothetical protein